MGGGGVEVELGGFGGILRAEDNVAVATTDIQRLLVVEVEYLVAYLDAAGTTDVEDAYLAAGGEVVGLQGVNGFEL